MEKYFIFIFILIELSILRNPIVGDIVAVKCMDQFYRGKIIDTINSSCFYLYLIDFGYVISASIDSLVDLSDVLKKVQIIYIL